MESCHGRGLRRCNHGLLTFVYLLLVHPEAWQIDTVLFRSACPNLTNENVPKFRCRFLRSKDSRGAT
eukprot:3142583-Amphidinium_carterae.1